MTYPIIKDVPDIRKLEYLVAKDFLVRREEEHLTVKLGNDELGVPDIFVFRGENLVYSIEISSYTFGKIQDLRPNQFVNGALHINIDESSAIHDPQENPYTIWQKKIANSQRYNRYNSERMILLLHSDVMESSGELTFAILGPMSISPSMNHFMHYKSEIIPNLQEHISCQDSIVWDEIFLIDYSENIVPRNCTMHELM